MPSWKSKAGMTFGIVPGPVPVLPAMMAITLCDFALQRNNTGGNQMSLEEMRKQNRHG